MTTEKIMSLVLFITFLIISNTNGAALVVNRPNIAFSASSFHDDSSKAKEGRFTGNAWTSKDGTNQYLRVDLGDDYVIESISTKGSGQDWNEWTTTYIFKYSMDGTEPYTTYQSFIGNSDEDTEKNYQLHTPIIAHYIEFQVVAYKGWPTLRVEAYGYLFTTLAPTYVPTTDPTPAPTAIPTETTNNPTPAPTKNPTPSPTNYPTPSPTKNPTPSPTVNPTPSPSNQPTPSPTTIPTNNPTTPSNEPTISPTAPPTTPIPSVPPTKIPTVMPTTASPTITIGIPGNEGAVGSISSTVYNADTTKDRNAEQKLENSNSLWMILGIGCGVFLCIFICLFYIKKRGKNKKEAEKFAKHINAHNTHNTHNIHKIMSVSSRSEIAMTSTDKNRTDRISRDLKKTGDVATTNMTGQNGQFGAMMVNLTGVNNMLMDDVIHAMDDDSEEEEDIIMVGVTTGGGPDDIMPNNNDEGGADDVDNITNEDDEYDEYDDVMQNIENMIVTPQGPVAELHGINNNNNNNDTDMGHNNNDNNNEDEGTTDSDIINNINEFETPSGGDMHNDDNNVQLTLGVNHDEFVIDDGDQHNIDILNDMETIQ